MNAKIGVSVSWVVQSKNKTLMQMWFIHWQWETCLLLLPEIHIFIPAISVPLQTALYHCQCLSSSLGLWGACLLVEGDGGREVVIHLAFTSASASIFQQPVLPMFFASPSCPLNVIAWLTPQREDVLSELDRFQAGSIWQGLSYMFLGSPSCSHLIKMAVTTCKSSSPHRLYFWALETCLRLQGGIGCSTHPLATLHILPFPFLPKHADPELRENFRETWRWETWGKLTLNQISCISNGWAQFRAGVEFHIF